MTIMSKTYLPFSDAVVRLDAGMWGGFKRADPVAAAKRNKINNKTSIGSGPWREHAGQRLTEAALNGELRIYVANKSEGRELFEHTIVPVEILKRLITVRETLPDHPIRLSRKIAIENDKLFALLCTGVLVVDETEFKAWYRSVRGKHKWPSQRSSLKARRGRPTKQSVALRDEILTIVKRGLWSRKDGIRKLGTLLGDVHTPSDDTLERLVIEMSRETSNPALWRKPRKRRRS
jgi:hypothetical protein